MLNHLSTTLTTEETCSFRRDCQQLPAKRAVGGLCIATSHVHMLRVTTEVDAKLDLGRLACVGLWLTDMACAMQDSLRTECLSDAFSFHLDQDFSTHDSVILNDSDTSQLLVGPLQGQGI